MLSSYLTNDGYPLGTTVWYLRGKIYGRKIKLFGRDPVSLIKNAIAFFTGLLELSYKERKQYIDLFIKQQKKLADIFAKQCDFPYLNAIAF